jgi:hypothetical protein
MCLGSWGVLGSWLDQRVYDGESFNIILIYIYIELLPTAGYKITNSIATLSYDNCYANLRDYRNSLLCDLL